MIKSLAQDKTHALLTATDDRLKREMAQPVIVDLRNIYRPEDMAALGFSYESIGRAPQTRN